MFVELHILQNLAPSNVNRDETGAPKECEFGGHRRARISSQALKRAMREDFKSHWPKEQLGLRSKRLRNEVVGYLVKLGRVQSQSEQVVTTALGGLGILSKDNDEGESKAEYLVFAGRLELRTFADVCNQEWDTLLDGYKKTWASKTPSKDSAKKAVAKQTVQKLSSAFTTEGGKSVDIALFGRMLADLPDKNIDAASQVAHAISTNRVAMDLDYYTAVDDLKPEDTEGADMIGTVGFNSSCFYRYANVDLDQLNKNLQGDEDLARKTVEAFLRASVSVIPTGKQNSFAAQNPPSLVFAVVRERGLWSLANAFLRPVTPGQDGDLVQRSIGALDSYWGRLAKMYGAGGISGSWVCSLDGDGFQHLRDKVESIDELVRNTVSAVKPLH